MGIQIVIFHKKYQHNKDNNNTRCKIVILYSKLQTRKQTYIMQVLEGWLLVLRVTEVFENPGRIKC